MDFNKPKNVPYLKAVFKSGIVPGGKNRLHPTQKHLGVLEEIIKIHTNNDNTIFDPFSGSAKTGLAALKLGRKFIGCEVDENYFSKAQKRLNDYFAS